MKDTSKYCWTHGPGTIPVQSEKIKSKGINLMHHLTIRWEEALIDVQTIPDWWGWMIYNIV